MVEGIELKVEEALKTDVGRGIVRLDSAAMKKLGVTTGDVVEIKGKKISVGVVWPAHPQDEGKNIIRADGYVRQNLGVGLGDKVFVKKTEVKEAKKVVFAPFQPMRFSPGFSDIIKKRLEGRALVKGDTIFISVFGTTTFPLTAAVVQPPAAVLITERTEVDIREEPMKEISRIPSVSYEDIGGLDTEIQKIREMVELPMRHPELFERLGIEPPKGVLIHGPPGCGKTLLAKAVANESDANFIYVGGPELVSKFVGESEERLRQLFKEAEENAPTIIFMDEIDAIAPKREEATGEVERRMVSQLLALMDGLKGRGNVIVIGATNRPNAIDPALRRPGRFDREIEIGVPDRTARKEILQIHTRNMPLGKDIDLDHLADITHGYTGADISLLCKEAAMKALRRIMPKINLEEEIVPPEILEQLTVNHDDFLAGMREIQPSALREVFIEVPNVHWKDIGDLEKVKQRLKEAVELPLKKPEVFKKMGIRTPKGLLLYGPPGCGKTLLAKAVATESEANFISIRGPEIFSKYVGESEKAVREIFRKARMSAPCIVFVDEIDAIAAARGGIDEGTRVGERVVNTLLLELDGLEELKNIVVIAATNRPDILDPALLRPGRFDEFIEIPFPDDAARLEILKVHTKKMPLAKDVDLNTVNQLMKGYSGADVEGVCREAGMNAIRAGRHQVTLKDFEDAVKEVKATVTKEHIERIKKFEEGPAGMYR
jgi:transitional endoplasmic reticulum ATPase